MMSWLRRRTRSPTSPTTLTIAGYRSGAAGSKIVQSGSLHCIAGTVICYLHSVAAKCASTGNRGGALGSRRSGPLAGGAPSWPGQCPMLGLMWFLSRPRYSSAVRTFRSRSSPSAVHTARAASVRPADRTTGSGLYLARPLTESVLFSRL